MISINVNDEVMEVEEGKSLGDFVRDYHKSHSPIAVALNSIFIPKSDHFKIPLSNNDEITLVSPMQGG